MLCAQMKMFAVLRPVQTRPTMAQQCCMMLDEILIKLKIKPTSSNMVFKRGQHVASNNVGWCWTNKLASFEQAFTLSNISTQTSWKICVNTVGIEATPTELPCDRTILKLWKCVFLLPDMLVLSGTKFKISQNRSWWNTMRTYNANQLSSTMFTN